MLRISPRKFTTGILVAASTIAAVGLLLIADSYLAHGLTAWWYIERRSGDDAESGASAKEHRMLALARTVEHRTSFPNDHRLLSRYAQHWDLQRFGVPSEPPSVRAVLKGWLAVPSGEARMLRVKGSGDVSLEIDGQVSRSSPLEPGRHWVETDWSSALNGAALEFEWVHGSERVTTVSPASWTPATGSWPPSRVLLWVIGIPLLLGLGAWLAMSLSAEGATRKRRLSALCLALIVGLGAGYRLFDYEVMPDLRENGDEHFATWNGWQLLTDGTTLGWSLWPQSYGGRVTREPVALWGQHFTLIRPYFEHPPLLHLLAGAAAKLGGAHHFLAAKLKYTRLVPIGLSLMSVVLVFLIGRRLSPAGPAAHFASLLYATLPVIVLQGRAIKEEALVVPLSLLGVLFYLRWRDGGRRLGDLLFAGFVTGLCTFAKVTGAFFVAALVMLATYEGSWRAAAAAAGAGAVGVVVFFSYGAALDWSTFWYSTTHQATLRAAHWNIFSRFFDASLINHNLVGRGHLFFLWLSFLGAVTRRHARSVAVLTLPPLVYLAAIGVASGNWTFGWYLMPLYPFLCLGAGQFLADLWREPDWLRGFILVALALMYPISFLLDIDFARNSRHWSEMRRQVSAFFLTFMVPFALAQAFRGRLAASVARGALALALCMLVALSGYFVARYDVIYDTHRDFDRLSFFHR